MSSLGKAFLTPAQVADHLQVNERTVHRWLRDGYLHGYKVGKMWRISPQDFEQFLAKLSNNT